MAGVGPAGGRLLSPTTDRARAFGTPRARSAASFGAHLEAALARGEKEPPALYHKTPLARGEKEPPALYHKTPLHEGLTKTGSPGHVQYMTWRVITQGSQWWIPAQPGAFVARQVAERMGPEVRQMLADGFRADVERTLSAALAGRS
jgi:hypothetical protein